MLPELQFVTRDFLELRIGCIRVIGPSVDRFGQRRIHRLPSGIHGRLEAGLPRFMARVDRWPLQRLGLHFALLLPYAGIVALFARLVRRWISKLLNELIGCRCVE